MNTRTQSALLIALACAAPTLFAQETSKPPAELDQLSVFVGDFQCNGQVFGNGSKPARATTGAVHGTKAVDGRWSQFSYDEKKTAANPTPFSVAGYMGYDTSKKQFVQTAVDNFGNYGSSFSDGWKGDTLTFEETTTMNGKAAVNTMKHVYGFVHLSPLSESH